LKINIGDIKVNVLRRLLLYQKCLRLLFVKVVLIKEAGTEGVCLDDCGKVEKFISELCVTVGC